MQPAPIAELLARCTFPPPGSPVTCAVSGGPDSTALMALASAAGLAVTAVHVDHGLRQGSAAEADIVAANAGILSDALPGALPIGVRRVTVDVPPGPNLEARARAARYQALPTDVMTGHTADDQAETVLLNLLRGASTAGMAGMRPGPRRPILALRRMETVGLCDQLGLATVDDPSNADPRHLRNRVRHELLPLLCELGQRDVVPILTRQAGVAAQESDLLDELAATIDPGDARTLAAAPPALARRAIRRWLTLDHPPDLATVERVLSVARGEVVATETSDGRRVSRSNQRLSLSGGLPPAHRDTPANG